ncbi:unnamed protein product [Didymodactylos carnosus]|uniref:DUF1264-domain-containing protein n=1 Tax=Didymodactylos carnosus TaxID=1234261 RepID=A0A813ZND2_9BILA|nr:unnamed protein product [Didymodactylos carnosus]CAF0900919.1 unnamed protein product [Didymodactylos carnosus]CAF3574438.1 unnamed protein product [Didymodactylos carnosus]CAF3683435.1 unnamed protein product [Didymodactylos carnosus]
MITNLMQKVIGYLLAFGAGAGATQLYRMRQIHDNADVAGSPMSMKSHIMDKGAAMLGHFAPINSIHQHVCGFHFYSGQLNRQLTAHHYCSHLNEDIRQCVIYDSDAPNARLIGVEYIISSKLFSKLTDDEKKLWHSHIHEVKSGELVGIGLPDSVEKEAMKELISTYGKTFHTWQVDRGDPLPLGIPQLMMGFTADGQVNPSLVKQRDEHYKISSEQKRINRTDIPLPEKDVMSDYWMKSNKAIQLDIKESKMKIK